jgi:ferrous iron transport protein B
VTAAASPVVALAGNPNSGKTTLFNALTGALGKTGNYPGVTVERRSGQVRLPSGTQVELLDIPGTYSLAARSPEEQVAVEALFAADEERRPDIILVVADATTLGRQLYLVAQLLETGRPVVLALSMIDEAEEQGIEIDAAGLAESLGIPVVPVVAARRRGLPELLSAVDAARADAPDPSPVDLPPELADPVEGVEAILEVDRPGDTPAVRRARALWALLSVDPQDELRNVSDALREAVGAAHAAAAEAGRNLDAEIVAARYARIDDWMSAHVHGADTSAPTFTERLDAYLTHPGWGFAVFGAVMFLLFELLFTGADPLIGAIEGVVGVTQSVVAPLLPEGILRGLVVDGIVAGVGNVIVFVPQIAMLFLFIGFLEDSGYLARVAFVIDRVMRSVGLHGKAFVPLLSGYACAIPAIMSTRTLENGRDRLVTMMAVPLMSCSARLPIYALVTAVVFGAEERIGGLVSVGAVVLLAMYGLSLVATLGAAAVLRRTLVRGPSPPLVLELPPYRRPGLRNLLRHTWTQVRAFLTDAGTIILAITIVLWALLHFPVSAEQTAHFEAQRAEVQASLQGAQAAEALARIDAEEAADRMRGSFAGGLGRALEPVIAPLGFDWRIGVGLIGAFAAREVLVSTLGIVWGVGEDADEENASLRERLREATREDGSRLLTPLSGLSLMVFFVLAAQCMSTLAVLKRESGSIRWPLFVLAYMTVLAYVAALVVFQGGKLLGFT